MKKALKIFVAVVLTPSLCSGLSGCLLQNCLVDEFSKKITYSLNEDGQSYCVSAVGKKLDSVVIPEEYEGLPVTRIGSHSFVTSTLWGTARRNINSLTLPKSITVIERNAFEEGCGAYNVYYDGTIEDWLKISFGSTVMAYCSLYFNGELLTELSLPENVTEIPDNAFNGCKSLEVAEIPEGVTRIGISAFSDTGIKSLRLPESLTSVGDSAFYYNKIDSVAIPAALNDWGRFCFSRCQIVNLTLPEGLLSVGQDAFENNILTELIIPSTLTDWGANAFANSHIEKLILSEGLKNIGYGAFQIYVTGSSYVEVLEELTIPQSVESIDDRAFYCLKTKKLNVPETLTDIGKYAFEGCLIEETDNRSR